MKDPVDNHVQRAYDHLIEQYKEKPRFLAMLTSFVSQVQALEDTAWDITAAFDLDTCDLLRLKILGRIVGQVYRGEDLEDYRTYVRVRIMINRSTGKHAELAAIAMLLLATSDLHLDEWHPKTLVLRVESIFPVGVDPHFVLELLRAAKEAGVGFAMIFKRNPAFKFSPTSSPNTSTSVGFGSTVTPGIGGKWATIL